MKKFTLTFGQRKFHFEYNSGVVWLIESKNSYSNFGQTRCVDFSEAKKVGALILYATGRIKLTEYNFNKN